MKTSSAVPIIVIISLVLVLLLAPTLFIFLLPIGLLGIVIYCSPDLRNKLKTFLQNPASPSSAVSDSTNKDNGSMLMVEELNDAFNDMNNLLVALKEENDKLKGDIETLRRNLNSSDIQHKEDINALSASISIIVREHGIIQTEIDHRIDELIKPTSDSQPPADAVPEFPQILYAKYPDVKLNGFPQDQLTPREDDSIYEIILTSADTAKFRLVPEKNVRRHLLTMLNSVVNPLCDIIVESQSSEDIVDIADGSLIRDGDCWILETKASIRLV